MNTKQIITTFIVLMITVVCATAFVSVPTITDGTGFQYGNVSVETDNIQIENLNLTNRIASTASTEYLGSIGESGYTGGHDVCVNGDYAYVASYLADALVIIDISDPANPSIVSTLKDTGHAPYDRLDGAHDILYANNHVFITKMIAQDGITSVDVSDPVNPVIADCLIDNMHLASVHALAMSADKNYIYAGAYTSAKYFNIIDISDPTGMSIVSSLYNAGFNKLRGGVEVGDYVYMCARDSNLIWSINVSDKNNPTVVDSVVSPEPCELDYDYTTGYLYATLANDITGGLGVYDFNDPTSLSVVSSIIIPGNNKNDANYIAVDGKYVFLTQADSSGIDPINQLVCVDISEPTYPEIVGANRLIGMLYASGLCIDGDYVYVTPRDQPNTQLSIFRKSAYTQEPRSKVEYSSRNMTLASGDVAYTCGFKPTRLDAFAGVREVAQSIGHSDEECTSSCIYTQVGGRVNWMGGWIIYIRTPSGYQFATVKSYDEKGYTLTWTKSGTPTDNIQFSIRAVR